MATLINGITGIEEKKNLTESKLKKILKKGNLFILSEDGLVGNKNSVGVHYVFSTTVKIQAPKKIEFPKSISFDNIKEFEANISNSFLDLLAPKRKELKFLGKVVNFEESRFEMLKQMFEQYSHQCKSVRALFRYIKNSLLDESEKSFLELVKTAKNFTAKRQQLKSSGDEIFQGIQLKLARKYDGVTEGEFPVEEAVSAVFKQPSDTLEESSILLKEHYKKVRAYTDIVRNNVIVQKKVLADTKKSEQENIIELYENLKKLFIQFEETLAHEEREKKERDEKMQRGSSIGFSDMTEMSDFLLGKSSLICKNLYNKIHGCHLGTIDKKYELDLKLFQFYNEMTYITKSLTTNIKIEKSLTAAVSDVSDISLNGLLFFQNLPVSFERCLHELVRRNLELDKIKKLIYPTDQKLKQMISVENEHREKFLRESEKILYGPIPKKLVLSIHNRLPQKADLLDFEADLPRKFDIEEAQDMYSNLDDFDFFSIDSPVQDGMKTEPQNKDMTKSFIGRFSQKMGEDNETIRKFYENCKRLQKEYVPPKDWGHSVSPTVEQKYETEIFDLKCEVNRMKDALKTSRSDRSTVVKDFTRRLDESEALRKNEEESWKKKVDDSQRTLEKLKISSKSELDKKSERIRELEERLMMSSKKDDTGSEEMKKEYVLMQEKVASLESQKKQREERISGLECELNEVKNMREKRAKEFEIEKHRRLMKIQSLEEGKKKLQDQNTKLKKQQEEAQKNLNTLTNGVLENQQKMIEKIHNEKEELKQKYISAETKVQQLAKTLEGLRASSSLQLQTREKELGNTKSVVARIREMYGAQMRQLSSFGFNLDEFTVIGKFLKFDGDMQKVIEHILEEARTERLIAITKDSDSKKKWIAIKDFKLNDPILFFKKEYASNQVQFEAVHLCGGGKKIIVLNHDCVKQVLGINENATAVVGVVTKIDVVPRTQSDIVYYRYMIQGIDKSTVF